MLSKPKIFLCLFALLFFLGLTSVVYANDEDVVNLPDFPQKLADALGMPDNLFAGELLACSIVLALFLLPTVFACSKFEKDVMIPSVFMGIMSLSFCVAMGWLPVWLFVLICLVVALVFQDKITGALGGSK